MWKSLVVGLMVCGILLIIAACTNQGVKSLLASCSAYSTALSSLAGYRRAGKLSDAQVASVERLRPVLNKACRDDSPDPDTSFRVVEAGLIELITIREAVQ